MKIWIVNLVVDPPETKLFFDKGQAEKYVSRYNEKSIGSWGKAYIAYEGDVTEYSVSRSEQEKPNKESLWNMT